MNVMKRRRPLLLVLLLGGALVFRIVLFPILVIGQSMEPTLRAGTLLLMKRYWLGAKTPKRFEIVVARAGNELVAKRVIGLPGEWVHMTNGIMFINGKELIEPFPLKRGNWVIKPGLIQQDNVLLIGDNRELPLQSFFILSIDAILGRRF